MIKANKNILVSEKILHKIKCTETDFPSEMHYILKLPLDV